MKGMTLKRGALAATLAMLLLMGVSACTEKQSNLSVAKLTALIDVRTEDKYVYGHIEGSVGADYQMDSFRSRVATLARDGHYGIFGGNATDAAAAIKIMKYMGFKHLNNLGSFTDAVALTHAKVVM